jgi:hypothetical protein
MMVRNVCFANICPVDSPEACHSSSGRGRFEKRRGVLTEVRVKSGYGVDFD